MLGYQIPQGVHAVPVDWLQSNSEQNVSGARGAVQMIPPAFLADQLSGAGCSQRARKAFPSSGFVTCSQALPEGRQDALGSAGRFCDCFLTGLPFTARMLKPQQGAAKALGGSLHAPALKPCNCVKPGIV